MNQKFIGDKADRVTEPIQNVDTVAIPNGTPVCLKMNGTDDGLAVVLPGTQVAAQANSFVYGVYVGAASLGVNQFGKSIVHGIVPYALVTRMTRAASSDSWTSSASLAAGVLLAIDTINNCFLQASASLGSNNFLPFALLGASIASAAASATATSDARTVITVGVRVFVRML